MRCVTLVPETTQVELGAQQTIIEEWMAIDNAGDNASADDAEFLECLKATPAGENLCNRYNGKLTPGLMLSHTRDYTQQCR